MERKIAERKKIAVQQVLAHCQESEAIFFLDIKGVSVAAERQLRVALRKESSLMRTVKARLARIALREFGINDSEKINLQDVASGQLSVVFSKVDSQNVAKALCGYQKKLEKDVFVLGGIYKQNILSSSEVVAISKYPAKPVGLQRLAFALNYPLVALAKVLKEVAEKK